jgi:hypothetical protein
MIKKTSFGRVVVVSPPRNRSRGQGPAWNKGGLFEVWEYQDSSGTVYTMLFTWVLKSTLPRYYWYASSGDPGPVFDAVASVSGPLDPLSGGHPGRKYNGSYRGNEDGIAGAPP